MSERLDKLRLVKGREWERQDSLDNIGVSTYALLKDAIEEGKKELAKDLLDYLYFREIKFNRDADIDLVGGFPQFFMTNYGEQNLYEDYRKVLIRFRGLDSWPVPPVKKRDMSAYEWAMDYAARMVRPHRMGREDGTGGFTLEEYDDRYEVVWDPCYTGGRTRRGDPVSSTAPHTAPPYNYAVNKVPHTWTGGNTGMTGYCIHCYILHQIMDTEQTGGYLQQWVIGYPEDPWEPCRYIAYKDLDWVPEEYYKRIGKTKPKPTSKVPAPKNPKLIKATHSHDLESRWINTVPMLRKAIGAGNKEEALKLVDRLNGEMGLWHPRYPLTWNWVWMDMVVERYGYNELYHALRSIYSRMEPPLAADEPRPAKADIPSAEERARKAALWGRGDRSGPDEGSVSIIDEPDRIVMELKPCGSGGRSLMKIDKVDESIAAAAEELKSAWLGGGPLTGPPFNFKVTTEAHPVAWNKVGVPHLCARCCVHFEMSAIARHGYLTTVVERPENHTDPNCRWFFYKDLDDVPEEYYTRIGARKPARQS